MSSEQHSLATYVSDMLALERHIRIPFDTQQKDGDFRDYDSALQLVSRLAALADEHIESLKTALTALGGQEASPVKSAVVEFEGAIAGAIDKMRKTKVSKSLRDDYTALSLCCVSYSMLLTTANAMNDMTVASLAQRFLQDYATAVLDIGEALPAVVVQELRAIDLNVDTSVIETSRRQVQQSWSNVRQLREPTAMTRGTIESDAAESALGSGFDTTL